MSMWRSVLFDLSAHNTLIFSEDLSTIKGTRAQQESQGFQRPSRPKLLRPFYFEKEIKISKEWSMNCKCTAMGGTSLRFHMACVKGRLLWRGLLTSLSFSSSASVLSTSLWSSSICSTFSWCSSSYTHTHTWRKATEGETHREERLR